MRPRVRLARRSAIVTERERAYELLRRITDQKLYASLVLQNESGFVRTAVLGVLRWRSRLDFVIASFAGRRVEKIDQEKAAWSHLYRAILFDFIQTRLWWVIL